MKMVPNLLMVLWTRPGWGMVFAADVGVMPGETAKDALRRYQRTFPLDVVVGAKGAGGRFVA